MSEDDCFEGSFEEHQIFREVFFASDSGKATTATKRCLVTGAISFECEDSSKNVNSSLSSNNDNSVVTSGLEGSEPSSASKDGSEVNTKAKRAKLSGNKGSPFTGLPDFARDVIPLRLVESSSKGVSTSSYLLKQSMEKGKEVYLSGIVSENVKKCDGKELKAIESPVSQESFATRVFSTPHNDKSQLQLKEGPKVSPNELSISETCLKIDPKEDPRPLLYKYVCKLLASSRWKIEKRPRSNSKYSETVYVSSQGRKFREFGSAWRSLGEILLAGHKLMETGTKKWTGINDFWSDLSLTLLDIEENMKLLDLANTRALWWSTLEPFVTAVFVDKKVGSLRKGNKVEVARNSVIDKFKHEDANLISGCPESVLTVSESSLLVYEENANQEIRSDLERKNASSRQEKQKNSVSKVVEASKLIAEGIHESLMRKKLHGRSKKGSEAPLDPNSLECQDKDMGNIHIISEENGDKRLMNDKMKNSKKRGKKARKNCNNQDDDVIKTKGKVVCAIRSSQKKKRADKSSKARTKKKNNKGGCRLLPRSTSNGEKQFGQGNWSALGPRTVLSWLIATKVISRDEVIQLRDPDDDDNVVKTGIVTKDGVVCTCCNKTVSLSEFKKHAGFDQGCPCLNLFMGSGKPFASCQLEAWYAEYKARRNGSRSEEGYDGGDDPNDDSCGICGDGGELICCDNCPSTFHQACLAMKVLPEGSWYCSRCTCWICRELVIDNAPSDRSQDFKCSQCAHKYHGVCLKDVSKRREPFPETYFCGKSCEKVHTGLSSRVGVIYPNADGLSWTVLKCLQEDGKAHSARRLALKAECNSKLAVALSIMEECFLSMVDARTGIDMIPHVLYNWGSKFARLDFDGFYTVVVEKNDVMISVASIRVHGVSVAEMPLVATCSKYRRQGMCRILVTAIEEMLMSLKVENLVVAALPSLVETWTDGFGFKTMDDEERDNLKRINLMVFPGTVLLKKTLYVCTKPNAVKGKANKEADVHKAGFPEGSDDEPPLGLLVPLGTNQTEPASEVKTAQESNTKEDCLEKELSKVSSEAEGEEVKKRDSSSSEAVEEVRQVSSVAVVNNVSDDEMLLCVDEQLDSDSSQEDSD